MDAKNVPWCSSYVRLSGKAVCEQSVWSGLWAREIWLCLYHSTIDGVGIGKVQRARSKSRERFSSLTCWCGTYVDRVGIARVLPGGEGLEVTKMALLVQFSSPSWHSSYSAKDTTYYSMSGCKMMMYVLLYICSVLGILQFNCLPIVSYVLKKTLIFAPGRLSTQGRQGDKETWSETV